MKYYKDLTLIDNNIYHTDNLKYFFKHKFFIPNELINDNKETLIFYAVKNHFLNLLNILIENKCAINIQNKEWKTPLHYAITLNKLDIVKILLDNGGDLNIKDIYGRDCMSYLQI